MNLVHELTQGLSILVGAYPEKNPTYLERESMYTFLLAYVGIIQHPDLPMWYRQHAFRVSRNMLRDQQYLTNWLLSLTRFHIWFDASDKLEDTRAWGPYMWRFLYALGPLYYPYRQQFFMNIISALPHLLPCKACGKKLGTLLNQAKYRRALMGMTSRQRYLKFVKDLHRYINNNHR